MSFLSIAFLAALPLAAAPILLHLFDRRRHVVIEWGAMEFLLEASTRKTSARRLKQWLLLMLRVLAVAALVLALAQPLLPGNWFGNPDRGETILVLDNSMSMARTDDDVSLFETAIERAIVELDEIESGDFVRVLQASPYPIWATRGSERVDADTTVILADQLRELRPTNGRSDLLSALFTAIQAEVQPAQKQRRIVLLTDRQRSDWSLDDEAGWKRLHEVLETAPVPTYLEVVDLEHAGDDADNVSVDRVHSNRTVVGVDEPFTLTARVRNHGRAVPASSSVTWTVGGEDLHEGLCPALAEGEVHDLIWKHSFSEGGVYSISCSVDADDLLAPDNGATVVVEVVDAVPVFVVESAPGLAEMQRDAFFVQAALGWIDGEPLDGKGVHEPTVIDPEDLAHVDLTQPRAVVIPNFQSIDEAAARQLEEFVFDGGGLWVSLGPRTDVDAFNQLLFADGNGLAPLALGDMADEERTTIDPFATEHPANGALADHERLDLADVSISRRFRFVPPPDGEPASELLRLSNGEPLAVEKYFGRGRVIVQSVPLRLQWSELARSQSFVVMVRDWLDYITQPGATRYNLSPGDPIAVEFADTQVRDATLNTPHGDEIELTADATEDGVQFRSSRTILPGDYALSIGLSGDVIPFHVNRDPQESNLTPLTADDHAALDSLAGLSRSIAGEALSGSSQNEPLWPTLLIILIAVMAAELLLSGVIARERFGSDPIPESSELVSTMSGGSPFGKPPAATGAERDGWAVPTNAPSENLSERELVGTAHTTE